MLSYRSARQGEYPEIDGAGIPADCANLEGMTTATLPGGVR